MPEDGDPKAPGLAPSVEDKASLAPLSTGVTADDAVDVATEGIDAVVDVLVALLAWDEVIVLVVVVVVAAVDAVFFLFD